MFWLQSTLFVSILCCFVCLRGDGLAQWLERWTKIKRSRVQIPSVAQEKLIFFSESKRLCCLAVGVPNPRVYTHADERPCTHITDHVVHEFGGLWKHEHNQHALVPRNTECGCPNGGGIKNGHICYPSYGGTQKKKFILMICF